MDSIQTDRLFSVLADETAREIFGLVSDSPRSAQDIHERCETSLKTVYRRLEALEDADLVSTMTRPGEQGPYTVYVSTINEIDISIHPDSKDVDIAVQRDDDDVDQFISIWDELQE
ncbi:helix-turn-helix domain-containing protein [Haloplanus salilacus]|uniref:ArsR/SmtB family transcription factor n=1 Tax=Haloplanus salilacus TaxID=2949994 RepID=UPI0030CE80AB